MTDVYFVNTKKGWVVGDMGTILHTADGGKNWVQQTPGEFQQLKGVFFLNEKLGWAIGWPGICLHTKNGGLTWNQQTTGTYNELYGVFFLNENFYYHLKSNLFREALKRVRMA